MLFTFLSLAITLFLMYKKQSAWFYIGLFSFGLVTFSLAIDGNFYGWWDYLYIKDRVESTPLHIYFWMVYLVGFITFVFLLKNKPNVINERLLLSVYGYRYYVKLRRFAYALFLLSVLAAVINLNRAGDLTILFSNPRSWEASFGQYVLLNYMYFLHLPALVVFAALIGKGYGVRSDWFIVFILLSLTVLHGIKFTILHGFLFFLFALYLARNERFSKFFYIGLLVLFLLLLSFFIFIRGGGLEGFAGYIISASVNSMYNINNFALYEIGTINSLIPINIDLPEKLYYRLQGLFPPMKEGLPDSFILNDSFNQQSAITIIGFGFGFGFIVASALLATFINYLRKGNGVEVHNLFLLVLVMVTILFMFTGWGFFKTKLWFGFFILLFIDLYLRSSLKNAKKNYLHNIYLS